MGVCLHNTKFSMDMGSGSFFHLRTRVAECLDEEFGKNYSELSRCWTQKDFSENDKQANEIIARKNLDEDVLDFLYQSDCDGKIPAKTCKKILDLVQDHDDTVMYGYVWANNTFKYFKEMLAYSVRYRANLVWS